MTKVYYETLDNLQVSWINDGKSSSQYLTAGQLDLSYCSNDNCTWTWQLGGGPRPGLCFIKCTRCGANAQIIAELVGSVTLACNIDIFINPNPALTPS